MTLTHLDETGHARMVDVSQKGETARVATARAHLVMRAETRAAILSGNVPKGDVLGVARVAGIMAAKRTAELIPLCHPLPITGVTVALGEEADGLFIEASVRTTARTGVEMEALTAASVAALTIYDMCKAIDRFMRIDNLRLIHKSGGASGTFAQD